MTHVSGDVSAAHEIGLVARQPVDDGAGQCGGVFGEEGEALGNHVGHDDARVEGDGLEIWVLGCGIGGDLKVSQLGNGIGTDARDNLEACAG